MNTQMPCGESTESEVAGSFLPGIVESFYSLSVIPLGELDLNIADIDPANWYPYSALLELQQRIRRATPPALNLCFRAGMNFSRIWYEQGPGKTMVHSGLDWLYAHRDGGGYQSVVRGRSPEEIGWSLLQSIDEEAGIAVYDNVTALLPDFVDGVFYGGCMLFDDMEYVTVESVPHPDGPTPTLNRYLLTVNFRLKSKSRCLDLDSKIQKLQPGKELVLSPEEIENLVWRYKGLQANANRDNAYYNGINIILSDAIAKSQQAAAALEASNRDLLQAKAETERANRELSETLQFNETILLESPIPMGLYAADGTCVQINDAYVKIFGGTRAALLALDFHNIKAWAENGMLKSGLEAISSNRPQRRTTYISTSFDKALFVEYRIHPMMSHGQKNILVQLIDLSERKRMEDELRHFAFHDALTHLANRRLLLDHLRRALLVSKRSGNRIAVLFIDLNKLKHLNDTYGHEMGDFLLIEVARRIKNQARETDTVARLGGDEFVILLEGLGTNADQVALRTASVAEKIRLALVEEYVLADIRHSASASVGIKLVGDGDDDPDQILKEADAAMYAVKTADRQMSAGLTA